jgi:pyruvate formate lyase activating enzyme
VTFNGIYKTSVVNYPGRVCTVLFVGGCNLKCGYCYNGDLVNNADALESYSSEDILSILKKRQNLIDAVTISGGEPTIYKGLLPFLKELKTLPGFSVKLDTNGLNPDIVKSALEENLIDMIALDIKTSPAKYSTLTAVEIDFSKVLQTLSIIKDYGVDYELRTTAVPGFMSIEDLEEIKAAVGTVTNYHIQQFIPDNTLDPAFSDLYPFSKQELESFRKSILTFAKNCSIKGI